MGSKRCCCIANAASTHETGTDGNLRTGRYQNAPVSCSSRNFKDALRRQSKTEGIAYPHLYHAGAARIALFTKNIDEEYARLKGLGVECVSEPVIRQVPNKAGAKFFCFKDPDGTFLELIEPFQNAWTQGEPSVLSAQPERTTPKRLSSYYTARGHQSRFFIVGCAALWCC